MAVNPQSHTFRGVDVLALEADPAAQIAMTAIVPTQLHMMTVDSTESAEEILNARRVKVLLCADDLPGETGLMFLARTRDRWPTVQRVLMAPNLDADLLVHAMREVSVFHYLPKPLDPDTAFHVIEYALRQHGLIEDLLRTRRKLDAVQVTNALLASRSLRVDRVVASLPRAILWIVVSLLVALSLGLVILSLLYFLKSLLGVDFMSQNHLSDFF